MIERETLLAILVGTIAGLLHVWMLWRAAHQVTPWTAAFGLLRVLAIGALLMWAAIGGQILAAAAAWAVSFVLTATWITAIDWKRCDSEQPAD